jgi:hypothetical protein
MFRAESSATGRTRREEAISGADNNEHEHTFLATAPAGAGERRIALAVVLVSTLVFAVVVPFVRAPLPKMPAFKHIERRALGLHGIDTKRDTLGEQGQPLVGIQA